jgi:hypothetical protein
VAVGIPFKTTDIEAARMGWMRAAIFIVVTDNYKLR